MTGKKIGYIRVSSYSQNPDRQLKGLELDDAVANDRHKETTAQIQAIHEEMKDFHGRLFSIEERAKIHDR